MVAWLQYLRPVRYSQSKRKPVEIPANTTATVYIPAANGVAITESGHAPANSKDIQVVGTDKGYLQVTVG